MEVNGVCKEGSKMAPGSSVEGALKTKAMTERSSISVKGAESIRQEGR